MLKNKRILVACERVVNIGNYESVRFRASVEGEIPDNSDIKKEFDKGWIIVENEINKKVKELEKEMRVNYS